MQIAAIACGVGGGEGRSRGLLRANRRARGLLRRRLDGTLVAQALLLSGALAALQLSAALYTLAVCDLVLPARDIAALVLLTGLVLGQHGLVALVEAMRARVLCRAGLALAAGCDRDALALLAARDMRSGLAPIEDAERIGCFLARGGPPALCDALWLPAFVAAAFVLHPALGAFAAIGSLALFGLAAAAERLTRGGAERLARAQQRRARAVRDLCAAGPLQHDRARRWQALTGTYRRLAADAAVRLAVAVALGRGLRGMLQSAGFGLGAWLVIDGALSPGALIASSLILGRAFSALDGALAHWRTLLAVRRSYRRLGGARS